MIEGREQVKLVSRGLENLKAKIFDHKQQLDDSVFVTKKIVT